MDFTYWLQRMDGFDWEEAIDQYGYIEPIRRDINKNK
jgi:hypothetical protein